VERFGRNEANWEDYKLIFKMDNPEDAKSEKWTEQAVEILPPEEDDLVSYERDRLQQIQENNRMLLALVRTDHDVYIWREYELYCLQDW
jgi:hypothetical protein